MAHARRLTPPPGDSLEAVRGSGRFAVSIRAADHEHVSLRFATKAGRTFEACRSRGSGARRSPTARSRRVVRDVEQEIPAATT